MTHPPNERDESASNDGAATTPVARSEPPPVEVRADPDWLDVITGSGAPVESGTEDE